MSGIGADGPDRAARTSAALPPAIFARHDDGAAGTVLLRQPELALAHRIRPGGERIDPDPRRWSHRLLGHGRRYRPKPETQKRTTREREPDRRRYHRTLHSRHDKSV